MLSLICSAPGVAVTPTRHFAFVQIRAIRVIRLPDKSGQKPTPLLHMLPRNQTLPSGHFSFVRIVLIILSLFPHSSIQSEFPNVSNKFKLVPTSPFCLVTL